MMLGNEARGFELLRSWKRNVAYGRNAFVLKVKRRK
jgi:hypothetical protein